MSTVPPSTALTGPKHPAPLAVRAAGAFLAVIVGCAELAANKLPAAIDATGERWHTDGRGMTKLEIPKHDGMTKLE